MPALYIESKDKSKDRKYITAPINPHWEEERVIFGVRSAEKVRFDNSFMQRGIRRYEFDYNIGKRNKEMVKGMKKSPHSGAYISKNTQNYDKFIELANAANPISSTYTNKIIKTVNFLREISEKISKNDIVTKYSKDKVLEALDFSVKFMGELEIKDELEKVASKPVEDDSIIIKKDQFEHLVENTKDLDCFLELQYNWNDNGAEPISREIIFKMKKLILELPVQPDIFPTACESIQFEYEKEDGSYLEFELFKDDKLKIFKLSKDDEEETKIIKLNTLDVVKVVKEFYE